MSGRTGIDRRTFFKIAGGGVVVFVSLGPGAVFGQGRRRAYPEDINAYLHIGEDGRVTVFSGKILVHVARMSHGLAGTLWKSAEILRKALQHECDMKDLCRKRKGPLSH